MAPFSKAVSIKHDPQKTEQLSVTESTKVFNGDIDSEWSVGSIPNGGYVLALIVEAFIQYQANTTHVDPIHITAHYLRPTLSVPYEIRIKTLKAGKGFTNLIGELVQDGLTKVTTHAIFGVNSPSATDKAQLTLLPPSSYARRIPLYSHPSEAIIKPLRHTWRFHKQVHMADDRKIRAKNQTDSSSRTSSTSVGGDGLEWGAWCSFVGEGERITTPSLAFLVDIFLNTPTLLPRSERPGLTTSWYPTVVLILEFKSPIPPPSSKHAPRTVGLYSSGKFINHPQGRHDVYAEVWTAPSNIGEGQPEEGWRDNQVCLAVSTQMALIVPIEVNVKRGTQSAKL